MNPKEFLTFLWGENPPGTILIWTGPDKISHWYTRLVNVNQEVERLAREQNVYTGVGLAAPGYRTSTNRRVKAHNVHAIAGLWADIDTGHPVHQKENLPPDTGTVLDLLDTLYYEPTLIVGSGHGIHAWWLFTKPWVFDGPEDRRAAQRLSQWWHRENLHPIVHQEGYSMDATHDLSRLLRVPGTLNHKEKPVPVVLLNEDSIGPRVEYQELLDQIPEEFKAGTPVNWPRNSGSQDTVEPGNLELDPRAEPPTLKLTTMLENDDNFRRSWERRRKNMPDGSPSAYDMSLARLAASAGWEDQEIVDLIIAWRRKHGISPKSHQSYYRKTLDTAREPIRREEAEEQLFTALQNDRTRTAPGRRNPGRAGGSAGTQPDDGTPDGGTPSDGTPDGGTPSDGTPDGGTPDDGTPGDGGDGIPGDGIPGDGIPGEETQGTAPGETPWEEGAEDAGAAEDAGGAGGGGPDENGPGPEDEDPDENRRRIREILSDVMNIKINRVVKYRGDPPEYWMSTDNGDITLGTANQLMNQNSFRSAIFAVTNTAVPTCNRTEWQRRLEALGRICEEEDVGEASKPVEETIEWLDRYMTENTVTDQMEQAVVAQAPFTYRDRVYFFMDDFRRWVESHTGRKLTSHTMGQRLRRSGWHTEGVNFRMTETGHRTTRTCWTRTPPTDGRAMPWELVTRQEEPETEGAEDADGAESADGPDGSDGE